MKNRNTKALLAASLILAVASLEFSGCKKGEEDPMIALRSRKARLTGTWNVVAFQDNRSFVSEESNSSGDRSDYESTSSTSFDGVDFIMNESSLEIGSGNDYSYRYETEITRESGDYAEESSSSDTQNGNTYSSSIEWDGEYEVEYSMSYTFEKDGTFTATQMIDYSDDIEADVDTFNYAVENINSSEIEISGTWAWIGGNKADEFKGKERVGLWYSSYVETTEEEYSYVSGSYSNSEESSDEFTAEGDDSGPDEVWEITQLKNKELKVMSSYEFDHEETSDFKYDTSYGSGLDFSGSSTRDYSGTSTGVSDMILTKEK